MKLIYALLHHLFFCSSFSLAQAQAQAQKAGLPTLNFSKLKPTGYDFETTLSARGSITARARGAYAAAQQVEPLLHNIDGYTYYFFARLFAFNHSP
jgi:hypothetical protein